MESHTWYDCCVTPYARVTFTVRMGRKPLYYIVNLVIPSLIFSLLTLISLILQPGSSDRIALGVFSHESRVL